nr:MAG TPA: hypothetical protein [Bacteriophage sp.]
MISLPLLLGIVYWFTKALNVYLTLTSSLRISIASLSVLTLNMFFTKGISALSFINILGLHSPHFLYTPKELVTFLIGNQPHPFSKENAT